MFEVIAEFACGLEDGFYRQFGQLKTTAGKSVPKPKVRVDSIIVQGQELALRCRATFTIEDRVKASELADRLKKLGVEVTWRESKHLVGSFK